MNYGVPNYVDPNYVDLINVSPYYNDYPYYDQFSGNPFYDYDNEFYDYDNDFYDNPLFVTEVDIVETSYIDSYDPIIRPFY